MMYFDQKEREKLMEAAIREAMEILPGFGIVIVAIEKTGSFSVVSTPDLDDIASVMGTVTRIMRERPNN